MNAAAGFEIPQLQLANEDRRRQDPWRVPERDIIRPETVRNRAATRAESLARPTGVYEGARNTTSMLAGLGPSDDDAERNINAAAFLNFGHRPHRMDPRPSSDRRQYGGEPQPPVDPPPVPDKRQYGRERLPRLAPPPRWASNTSHPTRDHNHNGQFQCREAFYIPNPNRHLMPQADHGGPSNMRPDRNRPNADGLRQQSAAPNHNQGVDCTQGTRRVRDGNLTCDLCAQSMTHFIWRCMGCGFQECDRCRGSRP